MIELSLFVYCLDCHLNHSRCKGHSCHLAFMITNALIIRQIEFVYLHSNEKHFWWNRCCRYL